MKKTIKSILALSLVLALAVSFCTVAMADQQSTEPKLITHYEFADAQNLGKDSAGTQNLTVIKVKDGETLIADVTTPGTAKQVDGPNGKKALEFDQTYALISAAADTTDDLKEFTISYLVSANDAGVLQSNVFSTGLGNGNFLTRAGINHLIDRGATKTASEKQVADGTGGLPDFRLMGGDAAATTQNGKWDVDQRKNDDGKNAKNFWKDRINYDATNDWVLEEDICKYAANDWYRVVIVVKLSDGTAVSQDKLTWPSNEQYLPGNGYQSMYMDKIGAVDEKSDFVAGTNCYTVTLPCKLTSVKNDTFGLLLGAAYKCANDSTVAIDGNTKNYARFIGKMADFRIYDKALTDEQVAKLYKDGTLEEILPPESSEDSEDSESSETSQTSDPEQPKDPQDSPKTGSDDNLITVVTVIILAVSGVILLRSKKLTAK